MKDNNGDIRFEKVAEHLLPTFDNKTYWEFIAARMRNYMLHLIRTTGYKPRFYPEQDKNIMGTHVARLFGAQHARMFRGYPSIDNTFSTRDSLDEIGAVTESLPKGALYDMHRCLHFDDDWEESDDVKWNDV